MLDFRSGKRCVPSRMDCFVIFLQFFRTFFCPFFCHFSACREFAGRLVLGRGGRLRGVVLVLFLRHVFADFSDIFLSIFADPLCRAFFCRFFGHFFVCFSASFRHAEISAGGLISVVPAIGRGWFWGRFCDIFLQIFRTFFCCFFEH